MGGREKGVVAWLVACATLVAGCGAFSTENDAPAATRRASSDTARATVLSAAAEDPPTPFVTDRTLLGVRARAVVPLQEAASPALFGWTSPLAVPSPDQQRVAYSAWQDLVTIDPDKSFSHQGIATGDPIGRPSIRIVDLDTERDRLVEDGAFSIAWRADGAFAYVKGDPSDFRANVPYESNIVVRDSVGAQPHVWTTTRGRYLIAGWARDTLLAYEMHEGEELDLLAFSGPGRRRLLASDASLVAISPDGTQALVSDGSGATRLLDAESGLEVARLDEPASLSLSYGGSWAGERIVAETAGGLVVLRASRSGLAVERTLALPRKALPMGVHEPQFADAAGSRVVAWAPVRGDGGRAHGRLYEYVDCDVADATCSVGPPRTDRVFSQTYNPSRPEARR